MLSVKKPPMLVRIHPVNPSMGYHAERYLIATSAYGIFEANRGWYEVDAKTARKLRSVLNNPQDPTSKPVFQIFSKDEAREMDQLEKIEVAPADRPIPLPYAVSGKDDHKVRKSRIQRLERLSEKRARIATRQASGDLTSSEAREAKMVGTIDMPVVSVAIKKLKPKIVEKK